MSVKIICDNCPYCPLYHLQGVKGQVTATRQLPRLNEPIILFVGQNPGDEEVREQLPFVGATSIDFVEKLRQLGMLDHSVLTNVIKCAPPNDVSEEVLRDAAQKCIINVMREIGKFRPKVICLLGNIAAGAFFKYIRYKRPPHSEAVVWRDTFVIWTYHPAAAFRNPNLWNPITEVLKKIKTYIKPVRFSDEFVYEVVTTQEKVEEVCSYFQQQEAVACDLEVDLINPALAPPKVFTGKSKMSEVISVALSDGKRTVVIPLRDDTGERWIDYSACEPLKTLILAPQPHKVFHNALFELMWFWRLWGKVPTPRSFSDTMLMYYVLEEERDDSEYGLKSLATRLLGAPEWVDERIKEARRTSLGRLTLAELCRYNALDAYWTYRLYEHLKPRIEREDLNFLLDELVYPLECLYALATERGIRVDTNYLMREARSSLERQLTLLMKDIHFLSKGYIRNPRSWQEKKYYLYQVLGLQPPEGEDETTKRSVVEALAEMYPEHQELLSKLIDFSRLDKLFSSYISKWNEYVDVDGCIRPEFKFFGTRTGRLSVSEPPIHNFPSERTTAGKEARRIFIPHEGYCFLYSDASQFEVRVMAVKSGDKNLQAAFFREHDVYTEIASIIFQKPPQEIDKNTERQLAKRIVLGIFYGMSAFGLARHLRISEEDAERYLAILRENYPRVFEYMEEVKRFAMEHGYVRNWHGRYRHILSAMKGDPKALRQVGNYVIQSEASDWWQEVALWFYRISYRRLGEGVVYILATIHDSIIAEVKLGHEAGALDCLRDAMILVSTLWSLDVPIDGEYKFFYRSLGDDAEETKLDITAKWLSEFRERGLQLLREFGLSPYKRRGL